MPRNTETFDATTASEDAPVVPVGALAAVAANGAQSPIRPRARYLGGKDTVLKKRLITTVAVGAVALLGLSACTAGNGGNGGGACTRWRDMSLTIGVFNGWPEGEAVIVPVEARSGGEGLRRHARIRATPGRSSPG